MLTHINDSMASTLQPFAQGYPLQWRPKSPEILLFVSKKTSKSRDAMFDCTHYSVWSSKRALSPTITMSWVKANWLYSLSKTSTKNKSSCSFEDENNEHNAKLGCTPCQRPTRTMSTVAAVSHFMGPQHCSLSFRRQTCILPIELCRRREQQV